MAVNYNRPEITVFHKNLQRVEPDRPWRSRCPCCEKGYLFVQREPPNLDRLSANDCCINCGQRFVYADITEIVDPFQPGHDEDEPNRCEAKRRLVIDLFLTYETNYATHFNAGLFRLMHKADKCNMSRLRRAFPEESEAYEEWRDSATANEFYDKYLNRDEQAALKAGKFMIGD